MPNVTRQTVYDLDDTHLSEGSFLFFSFFFSIFFFFILGPLTCKGIAELYRPLCFALVDLVELVAWITTAN